MSFQLISFSLFYIKFNEGHIFFQDKLTLLFLLSPTKIIKITLAFHTIEFGTWDSQKEVEMNYSHLRGKSIGEINIKMICNLQLFKRSRIIKCKGKMRTPGNKWFNWYKGCFQAPTFWEKAWVYQKIPSMSFISNMVKLLILIPFWLLLLNQIFSGVKIILWLKLRNNLNIY